MILAVYRCLQVCEIFGRTRIFCLRELQPPHSHIPPIPRCRRCFKRCVSKDLLPILMTLLMLELLLNTTVLKNVLLYLTCKHLMARVRRKHNVSSFRL